MKTIIIDDEQLSCDVLVNLIKVFCPTIQIVDVCNNAQDGINAIKKLKPELVFLDVDLQTMTGFELLDKLGFPNIPFDVIFCTAHNHYAVQAFRYSAVDFLLKPIPHKDLTASVMKAQKHIFDKHKIAQYEILKENLISNTNPRIVLPTLDGIYIVQVNEIIRMSSVKEKTSTEFVLTEHRQISVGKNLGEFDDLKPFIRVHRSDSVNPNHIVRYQKGGVLVLTDGFEIEVAASKREVVTHWLNNVKSSLNF